MRDSQRQKLYDAEHFVRTQLELAGKCDGRVDFHGSSLTVPPEYKFSDLDAVERYCHGVQNLNWFRELWPEAAAHKIVVRHRKGDKHAHYEHDGTIAVHRESVWALREILVLHELAHHVIGRQFAFQDVAPHGAEFAGAFLELVRNVIGQEVGLLLVGSYDAHRVSCTHVQPLARA